ncbi:MAG: hypothetical protein H6627_12430 [Calditrichae bacterium]|nr:hypothetical protein [Calditrichia bacterium]
MIKISAILLMLSMAIYSQSIVNSKHNLSVSGPGDIKATSESEICIFCHTPHQSSPRKPLWNRQDPGSVYEIYNTSTTDASAGQPDGSSVLCLSCHDGTIALGDVLSRAQPIEFSGGISVMPPGTSNLTTNLSDDHPISFIYNSSLAASDGELVDPSALSAPVKLENQKMQCTSCHEPHDDTFGMFLVATRSNSELCLFCHQKNGWSLTQHNLSNATWNGSGNDPWFHTPYTTVAENACENCHTPHNAGQDSRLTNYQAEENNCLDCHNGNVAASDVQAEFAKIYRHRVYSYTLVHDPVEDALVQTRHVECVDCHNPHYSNSSSSFSPQASGALAGVRGVNSAGNSISIVQNEYELCYRCHADSPDKPGSPTTRQIAQNNVRLEFDPANPSFHPVESAGRNSNVPSLISPLSESSTIYCSDCHASDNTNISGPHGSVYPHILKFNYETGTRVSESFQSYRLCYECHDRNAIINRNDDFGQNVHRKHIVEEDIPCNQCHDPHGISSSQGTEANNTHLINFNTQIVQSTSGGLEFVDDGIFAGRCYLRCHGKNHNPESYN